MPIWTLLYRDLWGPVWPNLASSAACTLPALWWHHRRLRAHIAKSIDEAVNR